MGGLSAGRVDDAQKSNPLEREGQVYLAGAIEYAHDGGRAWRREIGAFLREELKLDVFDPCTNEMDLLTPEEKERFRRWKTEDPERFMATVRKIIDRDLQTLLRETSFIVCYWDEHVMRGAGTAGELTVAYWNGIPVYVVLGIPREQVSSWALGCATKVFDSWDALKDFLRQCRA